MRFTKYSIFILFTAVFVSCSKTDNYINYYPDINSQYQFKNAILWNQDDTKLEKPFKRWVVAKDGYNLTDTLSYTTKYKVEFNTWFYNKTSLNRIDKFLFIDSSQVKLSIKKAGIADYDTIVAYNFKQKDILNYEEGKNIYFGLYPKNRLSFGDAAFFIRRVNKNNTNKIIEPDFNSVYPWLQNLISEEMLEPGDTIYQGLVSYYYDLKK